MIKDSRFHILLPITITDKDRVAILDRVDFLVNLPDSRLNPDLLFPIEDITPEMIKQAEGLHETFSKPNPAIIDFINRAKSPSPVESDTPPESQAETP